MTKSNSEEFSKPVMLCKCGKVLQTPRDYAAHCREYPDHFTKSESPVQETELAPSQPAPVVAKREFTDTESDSLAQVGYLLDRLPSDDTDADWTSLENGTIRHLYTMARRASPQPDRESERISMPRKVSHQMAVAIIAALDAGEPEKFAGQAPEKALQPIWDAAVKAVEAQS